MSDWHSEGEGPKWIPVLHLAETEVGIPFDLLARIAYQESHFRDDIIQGVVDSPVGALGIMQLMPKFFTSVRVARPFTDQDTTSQIEEAAHFLMGLYKSTNDWDLAIAAYNAGLGNVRKYGGIPPFKETQDYVAEVTADVPSINV